MSSATPIEVRHLWSDKELIGRLWGQAQALQLPIFLGDKSDRLWDIIQTCLNKHAAAKYHIQRYSALEKRECNEARRRFRKHPNQTRECHEMVFELEAFLFQTKSSLDIIVKLFDVVIPRVVNTSTYASEGDKVVKALTQYRKKSGVVVERVDRIIDLVQQEKATWIETVVGWRTDLSHYRTVENHRFVAQEVSKGRFEPIAPKYKGNEVVPLMRKIYQFNLEHQQDFLAVVGSLAAPLGFDLALTSEERMRPGFADVAPFIKYEWHASFAADLKQAKEVVG